MNSANAQIIDAQYGLEPVFEPSISAEDSGASISCRPTEFSLEVDHAGALTALATVRSD